MNKKKILLIICMLILCFLVLWKLLPYIFFSILHQKMTAENYVTLGVEQKDIISYNLSDLLEYMDNDVKPEVIKVEKKADIVFESIYELKINIENVEDNAVYSVSYGAGGNSKNEKIDNMSFNCNFDLKEGKNDISIIFYKNSSEINRYESTVYFVEPYKKQFLDELSNNGVSTHFIKNYDDIDDSIELLKYSGIKLIRNSIQWNQIENNGKYSFENIDNWLEDVRDADINVMAILVDNSTKRLGNDYQISNDEELEKFNEYVEQVLNRYSNELIGIEVWNEPNINWNTDDAKKWYSKMVESVNLLNYKNEIIAGSTATPYHTEKSEEYLKEISDLNAYINSNVFSYHVYSYSDDMAWLKDKNSNHKNVINELGGFQYIYLTEYGIANRNIEDENVRSEKLIKQTVTNITQGVDISILYNFIDDSETTTYGLLAKDLKPKKAYYAMKNFYENTNGAEYIGTLTNLERVENTNLEAHVYDKDGKPKIIVWSKNSNETITIPYSNFKATDLYGEEIQPNEEGNLIITTSPIYLDDLEYSYFYQAISNIAIENYDQFTEKFASEIAQVPELSNKIEENKNYMKSVGQVQTRVVGTSSIQAMQQHFELGNMILQAYKDGTLQTEDVKISSMLDMLNDIGDSYEDLVTVSAQTVVESDIEQTNTAIQEAEKTINNNQGAEIIYPVKILEFSKDHYEKATYINGLEEENDIKEGLIISNNLHALLLANWANTFAQINIDNYVDKYIANNPVTIEYNITELTNQNVKATIKTDAEIQITNNSNSKEHTFEQNGSFTFEYTIKGRALKITATVENIDKVAPTISGIQNGKLYTEPVTPKVNDENLQSIELKLNSQVVSNYENGDTLEEEGFYEITANDKAGNTITRYFQIFINTDTNYKIEENYIKNVTNNTTKSDFDEKINLSVNYKITRNGEEVSQDDILATGDILTTETGDEYIIIVPGDINKDGKVDLKDFIKMRIYLLLENNLDDIEKVAADCNLDGQVIGVKDYIRMRLIILMNDVTN